jgi:HEPN domain-containing protein
MTNISLAKSYLKKATVRLDILDLLLEKEAYSDVVREAQEIVELAVKGMLRAVGVEPPKIHEVGGDFCANTKTNILKILPKRLKRLLSSRND